MLIQYAVTVGVILALMLAWLVVQVGWRRVFGRLAADPDALAGRIGCHGCASEDGCDGGDCPDKELS